MSDSDEKTPLLDTDSYRSMSDDKPKGDQTADSAMETEQASP